MWAFIGLIGLFNVLLGFMLMRLWKAVDESTVAIMAMRIDLPTIYATRVEVKALLDDTAEGVRGSRAHLTELRDKFWDLDKRVALLEGNG